MGTRHAQKLSRAEFIAAHPACCYCNGRRATVEIDHAPARICFVKKHGPEGFAFPSCAECNRSAAISEQVMAFYLRTFDHTNPIMDEDDYHKLLTGIGNNAPDALPLIPARRPAALIAMDGGPTIADRTVTVTPAARRHIELFGLKVLYAIYYKVSGKFAGSSNRYLVHWAQTRTEAADRMNTRADAWFDKHVTGRRTNVDLGDQFRYQTGYHSDHGFFGIKMSFGDAFVFFGVVGPARDLGTLRPKLALCPSIYEVGRRLGKRRP